MHKPTFMFQIDKQEVINILKLKDISKIYNIVDIVGENIITKNNTTSLYNVKPCKVINKNIEQEQQIFSSYLAAIRMFNFNYKVIIETKRIDFNNMISKLDNNIYLSNNKTQKKIIQKYKEYLNELSNEVNVYDRNFTMVFEKLDNENSKALQEGFKYLKTVGIDINRVTKDNVFKKVYEMINKV